MSRRRPSGATPGPPPDAATALDIALRYLATRPRSRSEIERRLRRAGADGEVVGQVLDRLAALGLVDDLAFARWWQEQRDRHAPRGRRLIAAELRQRGVPRDALEQLDAADPEAAGTDDDAPPTEEDRARAALARHLRGRPPDPDPKALQRLGSFLVRRGFTPETARAVIREALTATEVDASIEGDDP